MQTSPLGHESPRLDTKAFLASSATTATAPSPTLPWRLRGGRDPVYRHPHTYEPIGVLHRRRRRAESWRREVYTGATRVINVIAALVGLLVTSPVMLVIALAIRLSSPGPILYVQERVGVDRRRGANGHRPASRRLNDTGGRIFRIYKFRTMAVQSDAPEAWAAKDDPRITPIGRFLRAYRLDELPQFLNVLKGDMNVVGPRPEQPGIFRRLRDEVQGYGERQKVLPGITGWAQINHSYDQSVADVERKLDLDLEYISRRSALEDIKIMARTMPVMVLRKGSM